MSDYDKMKEESSKWIKETDPSKREIIKQNIMQLYEHISYLATKNLQNKDIVSVNFFPDYAVGTFDILSVLYCQKLTSKH